MCIAVKINSKNNIFIIKNYISRGKENMNNVFISNIYIIIIYLICN